MRGTLILCVCIKYSKRNVCKGVPFFCGYRILVTWMIMKVIPIALLRTYMRMAYSNTETRRHRGVPGYSCGKSTPIKVYTSQRGIGLKLKLRVIKTAKINF